MLDSSIDNLKVLIACPGICSSTLNIGRWGTNLSYSTMLYTFYNIDIELHSRIR